MLALLKRHLIEVTKAVGPLVVAVAALQVLLIDAPAAVFVQFVAGALIAVVGMMLLFIGIDLGILPMGRFIGAALPAKRSIALIVSVAFALGFATTVAEPDVLVLSEQVEAASGGVIGSRLLSYIIAGGVGLFVTLAVMRILWGFPIAWLLAASYAAMLALSLVAPAAFVPLAYDAGSVTTGVLTAPVVLALAFGLTSVLSGRSALSDGFGLLGLASIGPILAVLLLGMLLR
jgi:hypothetical protein